jgi:hypothetical protein
VDPDVKFLLTLYVPIIVFGWILLLLDWLGRRHDRKGDQRKPA